MYYDKNRFHHSHVLAATDLTPAEFEALPVTFKYHWDEYTAISSRKRKIVNVYPITGKPALLPLIQDKMFFILMYLKTYPLQELHAIRFEMTRPQANRWIHLLSGILRRTLKTSGESPDRNSRRLIHILKGCENVLSDGIGRPIQRPCFGKTQASPDTDWMVLKYTCPKRNLKEKSLLLLKNRRTGGFLESGLKWSMP